MNDSDVGSKLVDAKGAPVAKPDVPTEDQPKPAEGPKVQCRITIDLMDNGQLLVNSNHLGNTMLMYGMMESAKDAVRGFAAQQSAGRIQKPNAPWWKMFGRNGQMLRPRG